VAIPFRDAMRNGISDLGDYTADVEIALTIMGTGVEPVPTCLGCGCGRMWQGCFVGDSVVPAGLGKSVCEGTQC
jgi:hypothetical protein